MKSLKAPELFRKTYFQRKVIKSGRCHNLGAARDPGGIFAATAHLEARFSCYFLKPAPDKIHTWKPFANIKIFAHGKIKSGRKPLGKKEKKTGPRKTERVSFCKEKKKIALLTRFPLIYTSTSLVTKPAPAQNLILKVICRFVVLFPGTFSGFSLRPLLCRHPLRSTERSR